MATHYLKTAWPFFAAVVTGDKTAELRRDDRNFAVNDTLVLAEVGDDGRATGNAVTALITHIVRADDGPWLAPGHVMLSLLVDRCGVNFVKST